MKKIFIVDDVKITADLLKTVLDKEGYETKAFYSAISVIEELKINIPDYIIMDVEMPELDGFEALKIIKSINDGIKVIIMTAYAEVDKISEFFKVGAIDFIAKPFKLEEIKNVINKADNIKNYNDISNKRVSFIGNSKEMKKCIDTALKLCNSEAPVLILGESGTGKEVLTDFIHYSSIRKYNNLVKLNCAAIPTNLAESELFGSERGAFTGAVSQKIGKIELANNGSLFLDEIGEISLDLQTKLLRVLEYKNFQRVGGVENINSNFRLICATNKNLWEEVKLKNFREDLYYRINTLTINVPPLKERKEDIPLLVNHFVEKSKNDYAISVNSISDEAMKVLVNYDWPGNVRELKSVIRAVVALTAEETVETIHLPQYILEFNKNIYREEEENILTLDEIEKQHIIRALKVTNSNKRVAARALGISEKTLYNKMLKYQLDNK